METQKIINLLNDSSNEESKFAAKKGYVIGSQIKKGKNKRCDTIKFETETIKSTLCDYSDAFILVTGNIKAAANNDTNVAVKNCAPFSTKINDIFVDVNLIEYSNNCSNASGRLWRFKRDEVPAGNADLTTDNSESFKYKAALSDQNDGTIFVKDAKIVVH